MLTNLQSRNSVTYIRVHTFTHFACSNIYHSPGMQVDSMREAVFIVSPKMLNLGSLVPMRPLKGGGEAGRSADRVISDRVISKLSSKALATIVYYISQTTFGFLNSLLTMLPINHSINRCHSHLTHGPVWMPMRMMTGVPSCGMRTCGGQSG